MWRAFDSQCRFDLGGIMTRIASGLFLIRTGLRFLRATAYNYAIARLCYRPPVRLSFRPSHGCIIEKRFKLGLRNFRHTVALSL